MTTDLDIEQEVGDHPEPTVAVSLLLSDISNRLHTAIAYNDFAAVSAVADDIDQNNQSWAAAATRTPDVESAPPPEPEPPAPQPPSVGVDDEAEAAAAKEIADAQAAAREEALTDAEIKAREDAEAEAEIAAAEAAARADADAEDAPDADAEGYEAKTVEELKDELRARDLPVSGSKDELIERLVADDEAAD